MCALFSVLAAFAAVVVAGPASATAAPAAIDEYDLALPHDDGPQDPAPVPGAEPGPAAPIAPTAPITPTDSSVPITPTEESSPDEGVTEAASAEPERELDAAAARRDVLFEAPAESPAREARTLAAPRENGSLPPMLWLLFGLGGACIVATLVRLRRFALGASPGAVPRSQSS